MIFAHARPAVTYHKDIIGLKFYDALRCGMPLVVSDVGEFGMWVRKKKLGLLFPAGNTKLFASAIVRLLQDRCLYFAIRRNIKRIGRNLLWSRTCKQLNDQYFRLVKRRII